MQMAVWPSGKAVDCKSSIPSSNLGAAYNFSTIVLFLEVFNNILIIKSILFKRNRECGEIGRHDGLKIRCLVIGVRVQVPPFPIIISYNKQD